MREIKFRAWHKKIRKMFQVGQITLEKGIWDYEPDDRKNIGVSIPYQPSFILMQYTGLHDKNGKEIYEGDIVKSFFVDTDEAGNETYKYYIMEVKYDEILCSYKIDKFMNLEVIGNVYENKELLNETDR